MENPSIVPAEKAPTSSWHTNVPLAIIIAGLMVSSSIVYVGKFGTATIAQAPQAVAGDDTTAPVVDPKTLLGANDPSIGSADAKVTIVEFSDFQCPFCRAFFEDTYAQLKKTYIDTGKARLVFRHFPLSFHPAAKPAALAAQCANDQSKFWQYHDKIFIEQAKKGNGTVEFGSTELKLWASQLGLNMETFNSCFDSAKYAKDIEDDIQVGSNAGVSGTPSFFINGKLLVGAQPFSAFQKAIDAELGN
jgi:protein-disulfide isomerase